MSEPTSLPEIRPNVLRSEVSAAPDARLVVFHYCISIVILTFKRVSDIKVIPAGRSRLLAGLPYTLITLVAGWWGIPWGPIWTIQALVRNLRGGTDVTDLVNEAIAREQAAAERIAEAEARRAAAPTEAPGRSPESGPAASADQ